MISFRRIAVGLAVAGAVSAGVLAASPAEAGTTRLYYACNVGGIYGWQEDHFITITTPATARQGDTVTVEVGITGTISRNQSYAANTFSGGMTVDVFGATSTWIFPSGMTNPDLRPGDPYRMTGGTAQVTLANVGDVSFAASTFTMGTSGYGWVCLTTDNVVPISKTRVLPR